MKTPLLPAAWLALSLGWSSLPAEETPPAVSNADEPARIQQRARIEYPARPLAEGLLNGRAVIMLHVDAFGELRDQLVVAYTHRDFADAVLAAVKQWRFTPGRVGGEPAGSNIRIDADFQVHGVLAYVKPVASEREEPLDAHRFVYHPWGIASLDRPPAPVSRPGPIYPREWIDAGRVGTVIIEFFIDEEGRARFPEVVGDADELLGVAAAVAIRDWRFEPPRRNGRPVLVRVQQAFHFRPQRPAGKS